jgi:hypothetical protein
MKIRLMVAAGAATLLAALVAAPVNVASAVSYNYGSRDIPLGAVAGGARIGVETSWAAVGLPSKALPAQCSTGVPWRLANGTRGFLTAGHCLPANGRDKAQIIRTVSSTSWTPGPTLGQRASGMTSINASGTIRGKVGDIAFVPSELPVGNYLFTGGPGSRSLTRITSWTSKATPGYLLCFSGFRTGSRCGLKQGKKTSYRDGAGTFTGIAEAYYGVGSPSQRCPQPGDSGGVVYRMSPDGRSAYVVGIVSGAFRNGFWSLGCNMLYTPLGAAQKQFGGGPIIS